MSEVTTIQTARVRAERGDEQAQSWLAEFDRQRDQSQTQDAAQQQRIYDRAHRLGCHSRQG